MPAISKGKLLLLLILSPLLLLAGHELYYFNSAYSNIMIGEIDVGGKSRKQVEEIITREAQTRENATISFSVNKSTYIAIKINKDILTYDIEKTTDEIMNYGRTGTISDRVNTRLQLLTSKHSVLPIYSFDKLTFDTLLADEVRTYEKPVVETQLTYTASGLILTPSKPGVEANREAAINKLGSYFDFQSSPGTIELELEPKEPRMTRENSQEILSLAQRAVSRPITLFSPDIPDKTWTIDAPQLYDFLEIKYDEKNKKPSLSVVDYKVASYSAQFAPLVKKDAKEPKYQTVGSKIVVLEPSEDGRELDTENLTKQLSQALFGTTQTSRIQIPVKTVKPALALEKVNQYGIKEVIASGTSHFNGSTPARIHNIETAAEKLNGTLIKPGQVFSMYNAVGNIEKSTGFEDSYIIKNGRTVVGVGGGVCQVSTTLFRAALNAGFVINERHPHSYRVKYYEQDSPPGFDAAIFFPKADLKFTNNTGNYALIQTKLDKSNWELTFNLYGIKDGRTVEISKIETKNQITPPKEVRINDASIPRGIIRQTEYAAQGADVTFNRKVVKDGKEILSDTIKTHYYPWQAVFLVGTKEN